MKRTQRISLIALTLIIALLVVAMFGACANKNVIKLEGVELPELNDNQFAIVIKVADKTYEYYVLYTENANNLYSALEYLNANEGLELVASDGEYGKFITQIGDLVAEGNKFIALYTSVKEEYITSAEITYFDCGGVEVATAGYGASSLTVSSKAVFYIQLEQY